MQPHPRYEILGLIGNGDFAAVYRARDRELGRDVAIKQIHGQYLNDPRRLERFWREAQLLAALAHPHVMTIYDIDRPRGWLVLELMQGTLLDASRGEPIDLELLRSSLAGSLEALAMLHANKVIHGDIKPSNLMLDRMGRIKLGDFGLARRVASDQGSYLKGATRYMAPELVAPQFGPVGPGSDLYSLGFSAYELLAGPQQFENLFPGLDAFGRDRQIAWMMWHAAPDRRLPPVASVLDGVPDDLARVIDRLTIKDQAKRYQSAEQALADLAPQQAAALPPDDSEAEEAALARRQQFQRRLVAGMALAVSLLVSVLILVMPSGSEPPPAPPSPAAVRGIVRTLLPERQTIIVEQPGELGPKEIVLRQADRVYLNDKASLLRELRELDQVMIELLKDEQGRPFQEVHAWRPRESTGTVAEVKADVGELIVSGGDGGELKLTVGPQTPIELNGESRGEGRPLALVDLAPGDSIRIEHFRDRGVETALKISAHRIVEGQGIVRAVDPRQGEVTLAESDQDGTPVKVWKLAPRVEVTLNGRGVLDNRLLTPADLLPGDRVTYKHDSHLVRIDAQRVFADSGTIQTIRYDVQTFVAAVEGGERTFVLAPQCTVTLGGQPASYEDLRRGDQVNVTFDSPDAASPAVTAIDAVRPPDPTKWAILIDLSHWDDATLPEFPAAGPALDKLQQALASQYAVPREQIVLLRQPSRVRLEQGLSDALSEAGGAGQLLVVVAGRAAADGQSPPLLAPVDFDRQRPAETGVPLTTVLTAVENASAQERLVVLELHAIAPEAGNGGAASAAAMVNSVRGTQSRPLLRKTPVFATAHVAPAEASSAVLVDALASGVRGLADADRDNQCTVAELNDHFRSVAAGKISLILPETTPPRLTDDAKEAIRRIAAMVAQQRIEKSQAESATNAATQLAPRQPEPKLVGAILLLKAREHEGAITMLEQVVAQHPQTLMAWKVSAWARFEKLNYGGGMSDLVQLVRNLPPGKVPESEKRAIPWVGRLREFAAAAVSSDRRPPQATIDALDAAIAACGTEVQQLYRQGREAARDKMADFERQIAAADGSEQLRLRYERQALRHYASFSLEAAAQQVVAEMDAE